MAMHHNRLLFSKSGRACYISHLDLMATFQRAFLRSGIEAWQTEGFNRHIFVSIALPLSVGYSSECEILEFNLESKMPMEEVVQRLNGALPEGITVRTCYEAQVHLKKLTWLDWEAELIYDGGIPDGTEESLAALLGQESWVIQKPSKKSKKGFTELDLIPMVRRWSARRQGGSLFLNLRLAAQNPGLNPAVLVDAWKERCPEVAPDFARYHRIEVYGEDEQVFR